MPTPSAATQRESALQSLATQPFDLLVIGGGIVGAGVARDAAMRGLKVAIVDQHDFAFGTSSRSSRLLHGGLRYLAQGRVRLVREASVEKRIISNTVAPHLSSPLAFVFPTYKGSGLPLWKLKIGVKLYDLLCSGKNLGKCSSLDPAGAGERLPGLDADGLVGAVRYFDALTNDARLVIDTIASAARAGAIVANYVRVGTCERVGDSWTCAMSDRLQGNASFPLTARAIVNATGPWADLLEHSQVKLRRTKGIHLVIDRSRLPVQDATVMTEGSRLLFVIPWGERVILGTTDTDFSGANEDVRTEPDDVAYVLRITNELFPNATLTEADVVSHWAGLRPLLADPNGKPSDISRSHEIKQPKPFWWDVAGGKLTTYRLMAEQTVDQVVDALHAKAHPCRTADEPLLPADDAANSFSGIVPPAVSREAVEHYCDREWAEHLDDVMLRRTSWGYYAHDANDVARQVAGWMGERLAWDGGRIDAELSRYASLPVKPK